jgi:hypothetical protein
MILVPGTIAWRKRLERTGPAKPVSRYDKAIAGVRFYQQRQRLGPDQRLAAELDFSRIGEPNVDAPTTRQKLTALTAARTLGPNNWGFDYDPNVPEYMARNTAYVLLDGKVLLKYHKQGDFHEVLIGKDTVHIPGKLDGRFQVTPTSPAQRTINFGLEVCLDHVFQTTGKEIAHLGKVDVHIISSAQVPTEQDKLATTNAGYVVHACSNKEFSGVKGRTWYGGLGDATRVANDVVAGFPLQLFLIELDLTPLTGTVETPTEPRRRFY